MLTGWGGFFMMYRNNVGRLGCWLQDCGLRKVETHWLGKKTWFCMCRIHPVRGILMTENESCLRRPERLWMDRA